jgi:hypothetical protein
MLPSLLFSGAYFLLLREVSLRLSNTFLDLLYLYSDNDWNDCPNPATGLALWKQEFLNFESRYWNHTFQIGHQPGRTENFVFIHKNALFIGLNLVGGEVLSQSETTTRLTEQVEWTMQMIRQYIQYYAGGRVVIFGHADPTNDHAAFFGPFRNFVRDELANSIPILYLNGDKHSWLYQSNFYSQSSFLRVQLEGGLDPPALVTVNWDGDFAPTNQAFGVDRMLS